MSGKNINLKNYPEASPKYQYRTRAQQGGLRKFIKRSTMKPMHKLIRIVRIENIKRKACPKWPRPRPMQLTQNVTIGKTETYQNNQTSKLIEISDKNINHTKNSSRYQNIKSNLGNAPHALTSKVFSQTTPGTSHDNATPYEDRKAHQVRSRQRNQKATPPETNYPAHCNCLSHNCSIRLTHSS
jgi:hypothetical protein